jgi:hypothetical protein
VLTARRIGRRLIRQLAGTSEIQRLVISARPPLMRRTPPRVFQSTFCFRLTRDAVRCASAAVLGREAGVADMIGHANAERLVRV